eukprot:CAMPEP_0202962962 /NCGR_PEP_ID=MMETSP1396-20130829/6976_1 /ASSEMBLY_ACC=CAM_ASM_000872 /TAXON_ID= /ORGANISM="Pseudokeronopsis sp., Strain Brazil" /LENGTH=44 /DNA_ID= /DNA_START= /DNA_END= /DNA_ORIENTATION=
MASKGAQGSMVILVTDGQANVGLGSLNQKQDADKFYKDVGKYAQ